MSQNSGGPPSGRRRDQSRQPPPANPSQALNAFQENFSSPSQAFSASFKQNTPSLGSPATLPSRAPQVASASRKRPSDAVIRERLAKDFEETKAGIGEKLTNYHKQALTDMDTICRLTKELERENKAHEAVSAEVDGLNYKIRLLLRYIPEDALDSVLHCYHLRIEPPPISDLGSGEGKSSVEDAEEAGEETEEQTEEQTEDETEDEDDNTAQTQPTFTEQPSPTIAGNLEANPGSLFAPPTKTSRARPSLAVQMPQQHGMKEPKQLLQASATPQLVSVSRHPEPSVNVSYQQNQQAPVEHVQHSTPLAVGAQPLRSDGIDSSRQTRANNAGFTPCALPQVKPQKRPYKRSAQVVARAPRSSKKRCTIHARDGSHPDTYTIRVSDLTRGTLSTVGLLLKPLLEEQFADWDRGFLKRWRDLDTTGPTQCLTMRSQKLGTTRSQEGTACTSCEDKGKVCVSIIEEGVLTIRPLREEVRNGGSGKQGFWVVSE